MTRPLWFPRTWKAGVHLLLAFVVLVVLTGGAALWFVRTVPPRPVSSMSAGRCASTTPCNGTHKRSIG